MKQKIQTLQTQLAQGLINREDEIKASLLTMIAGENIVLVGPPGTGKSMVARKMSEALAPVAQDNNYFEYLLTKFSTPEEIFGPLSISELKKDNFVRNTAGYLPTARVAFLDEIFKASSSILNALLTVLNERKYHNGTKTEAIPLQTLVSASNELPNGDESLSALYDRFLVRKLVDFVDSSDIPAFFNLPKSPAVSGEYKLTQAELDDIQQKAECVVFPDEVQQAIMAIWAKHKEVFKEDADEFLSDRKLSKVLHLLRVSAVTNARDEVDFSDVMLLKDCLWNHSDNIVKVRDLILVELSKFNNQQIVDIGNNNQKFSNNLSDTTTKTSSNIIKGYQGSGTADDPILIGTVDELLGLQRADVGQKGYYFKQIADIDCSEIRTWQKIDFKGFYNGNGFKVSNENNFSYLFNKVTTNSIIENLNCDFGITNEIQNSRIRNCKIVKISYLDFANEKIDELKSYVNNLPKSTIENCFVKSLNKIRNDSRIAIGEFKDKVLNKGDCIINNSVLVIKPQSYKSILPSPTINAIQSQFTTSNSFYIDMSNGQHDQSSEVDLNQLTQFYFENTLGWDFDNIWEWDSASNEPKIRQNINTTHTSTQTIQNPTNDPNQKSLLQQQLENNIWL